MRTQLSMMSLIVVAAVTAAGCQGRLAYNLPPSERLMHPGPGVGGPGPGVLPTGGMSGGAAMMGGPGMGPGMGMMGGGACQAMPPGAMPPGAMPPGARPPGNFQQNSIQQVSFQGGCIDGSCMGGGCMGGGLGAGGASQVAFLGEEGTQVQWDVSGQSMFDSNPLVVPGRQNFSQGAIYRLRVSSITGRPGVQLYPTLEIAPVTPRTDAYLAHAPIPVQFSEEDFDQVLSGNFVTKVMYLPDPEFQELALAGVETLVSARLDPGVDPIAEADRRGSILAILRIGSKDLEMNGGYSDGRVLPAQFEGSFDEPMLEPVPSDDYSNFDGPYPAEGEVIDGDSYEGESYGGESYGGQGYSGGQGYHNGMAGNTPMGMQTAGFAPAAMPPHMMPSMGPQYGMPITGTPIGLPGPPHIPLGAPAGLQKHVMKNRTRMAIPSPVEKFKISVKQRPGLNYPEPVRKVKVDETVRQPFNFRALLGK